jgi:hypothetical protein
MQCTYATRCTEVTEADEKYFAISDHRFVATLGRSRNAFAKIKNAMHHQHFEKLA